MSGTGSELAAAEDAFAASRGLFEQVTADLSGPDSAELTHSQLEDLLGSRMREVTRSLFQDHLNLRALTETAGRGGGGRGRRGAHEDRAGPQA